MIQRMLLSCIAVIGLSALVPAAPVPKYRAPKLSDVAAELKKMQGTYELHYPDMDGRLGGRAVARSIQRIRIEGDKWSYVRVLNGVERTTTSYVMHLDLTKKPMALDLKREGADVVYLKGIVQVDGDTITFAYVAGANTTQPRPAAFGPTPDGNQAATMTLKKVIAP